MTWGTRATRKLTARVVNAYGAVCHLCKEPIDLTLEHPHKLSLSIDHVVPRSAGGSNEISNLRPAHLTCNTSRGARPIADKPVIDNRDWFNAPAPAPGARRVVLVCGAPGSGKTTLAHSLASSEGLKVYDIDAAEYDGDEVQFKTEIARLSHDPNARAVVIRSGATQSARDAAANLIGATDTIVLKTPADECKRRIRKRNRPRPPLRQQFAAVDQWYAKHNAVFF